jgi:hypothetical protein
VGGDAGYGPHDREAARRMFGAFPAHLAEACISSISEIFDAQGLPDPAH